MWCSFRIWGVARIWGEMVLNQSIGGCMAPYSINTTYVLISIYKNIYMGIYIYGERKYTYMAQ